MFNLDEIVKMYFSAVSAEAILKQQVRYNEFSAAEFKIVTKAYLSRYSDTENTELYEYIRNSTQIEGHPYAGLENRSGLNVFAALEELAEQLLTLDDNKVVCQYAKLLRFREVTRYVDEDILVCAYKTVRFRRYGEITKNFDWEVTIGHNNMQLNRIVKKGISENHFHLYGSAPSFQLIWLDMMNHTGEKGLIQLARQLDEKPRTSREHYYNEYREENNLGKILKAALIRVYLTTYLRNGSVDNESLSLEQAEQILSGELPVHDYQYEIQQMIDRQNIYGYFCAEAQMPDYALYNAEGNILERKREEMLFAGERWLSYQIMKREVSGEEIPALFYQWFYAYLVLKNNIRNELVQTNHTVGFENFQIYNKRKNIYRNQEEQIYCAVMGSVRKGNMKSLEIRLTPGKTAAGNAAAILSIENIIKKIEGELKQRGTDIPNIYYVLHFPKRKDDILPREEYKEEFCRHYEMRKELYKKERAVCEFREQFPHIACHILGIDACSQEIGCRPEVFAPTYRALANHVPENILGQESVRQLRKTYHVGEDFEDVVDGLRAVDEAVRFLNLQCGDRIGHGTVLGIDVEKWYAYKNNTILIGQQDYLDSVVWLYFKLAEFRIPDCENLKQYLEQQFDVYFNKIYLSSIQAEELSFIWLDRQREKELRSGIFQFNIYTYYEAWKLRGDAPELYRKGYFDKGLECELNDHLINNQYPEKFESRYRKEVSFLYYAYHYNWNIRKIGQEPAEIYISPDYINSIVKLQKAYARYFSSCGIGIETNPSSNVLISTISDYEEHPIIQLYNKDLTWDIKELKDCPQANVSINTDDKGVFHTSLENEYALMACALEKSKDGEEYRYNRQMVYQWLDNIREMGNLQSFYEEGQAERREETDGVNFGEAYFI